MIAEIVICVLLAMFIIAFWLLADNPYSVMDKTTKEEIASNKTSANLAIWERDVFGEDE